MGAPYCGRVVIPPGGAHGHTPPPRHPPPVGRMLILLIPLNSGPGGGVGPSPRPPNPEAVHQNPPPTPLGRNGRAPSGGRRRVDEAGPQPVEHRRHPALHQARPPSRPPPPDRSPPMRGVLMVDLFTPRHPTIINIQQLKGGHPPPPPGRVGGGWLTGFSSE